MKLDIVDLNVDKYKVNLSVDDNEKIGVFSFKKDIVKKFLELISGINNNKNTIFLNQNNVYDNKEYFKERIFLDFNKKYLSTLRVQKIYDSLKQYNIEFDKDKFIKICKELNVRGETDISYKYEFSKVGVSFVNLALVCSCNIKNIIINNPTINLILDEDINYFVNKLTNEEFNTVILGLNSLNQFQNKLTKILIFSDFDEAYVVDENTSLIAFENDIDRHFLIKNKLFRGNKLICLNTLSKDDLKNYQRMKVRFDIINIYEIEKYLGDDNEKN